MVFQSLVRINVGKGACIITRGDGNVTLDSPSDVKIYEYQRIVWSSHTNTCPGCAWLQAQSAKSIAVVAMNVFFFIWYLISCIPCSSIIWCPSIKRSLYRAAMCVEADRESWMTPSYLLCCGDVINEVPYFLSVPLTSPQFSLTSPHP